MKDAIDDFLAAPDGDLRDLADDLDVRVTRGKNKGRDIGAVNEEIRSVRREIRDLRPAWESANLEPFVLNKKTFRYHEAEKSAAIDTILDTKLNLGEGLIEAIDEVRLFAFAGDLSPLSIQGLLGILADPITGARGLPKATRTLFKPETLIETATKEPELVARFTQATGRAFGQLDAEFRQAGKGIERIPGFAKLNERLLSAVEMVRYNQWKFDTRLVQASGKSVNVADAEAANSLSKVIPALNPAERGTSILRSRAERVPVISTSFLGGPPTVLKDAASGLAKFATSRSLSPQARWGSLAGREQLALVHLTSMFGSLATLAVGSHIASGWSPSDAVKETLTPGPRFLSIALGRERRIPLGGPFRSAAKAFLPQKVGEVGGVPIYAPFTGTAEWLKGKATPALTTPIDIARNKDYFGGKIREGSFPQQVLQSIWYGVNNVLPLAAAEPSEAVRTGEVDLGDGPGAAGRLAELSAAQFAGVDLRETSVFENLRLRRDELARQVPDENGRTGRNYEQLDQTEQLALNNSPEMAGIQAELDAREPRTREAEGFDLLKTRRGEQLAEQESDDVLLAQRRETGEGGIDAAKWREDNTERKRSFFDRREEIAEDFGIEFERSEGEAPSNKIDAAIDAYFSVDVDEFTNENTKETDWGRYLAAREQALAKLSAAERRKGKDFLNRPEIRTATERAFEDDQEKIAEMQVALFGGKVQANYWEVPDAVWDFIAPQLGAGVTRESLESASALAGGEGEKQALGQINSIISEIRSAIRIENAALDAHLVYWGYASSLQRTPESRAAWERLYPDALLPAFLQT